jgi:hypothetical protein
MILGGYDPSGNTGEQADIDQSPIAVLEELLPGDWLEGAVSWDGRKGPMLRSFNEGIAGEPALQIDPVDGFPLIKALRGAWYYPTDKFGKVSRDLPKKPNHPHEDTGDAFCYFVGRIAPGYERRRNREIEVETDFKVGGSQNYTVRQGNEPEAESEFTPGVFGRT